MGTVYQEAREKAGLTQAKASELLNISSNTISSYEQGRRNTPDDIAVKMGEIYNNKLLVYQHLKAKESALDLPIIKEEDIITAVLRLICDVRKLEGNFERLLAIAYDNTISEEEAEDWALIMSNVKNLQKSCLTCLYATKGSNNE